MKIAMINPPIVGRGGGERQVLRLATELQRMGDEVEIFVSELNVENSYPDMLKNLTVNVISHPLGKKLPRFLKPQEASQKPSGQASSDEGGIREWMRRNMGKQFYTIPYDLPTMINIGRKIPKGFDVVNNHNYPSEWAAFYAKKRLKAPVVWMCNEPPFWFFVPELRRGLRKINWPVYSIFDRFTANYVDEILVLSHIAAQYVNQAYGRSSTVVRSGVDADLFHNSSGTAARERLGLGDSFVLLQVGNIELNKRQIDAVKALKILSQRYDNLRMVFNGGGRKDELIKITEELGVKDKVLIMRSDRDEELAEVYAACDVFLFPAQITWGLAVVEAMASSKPVIVSRKCGASEIIQDNVNGLLVNHKDPADIARQVERLINYPRLRRLLGENAYRFVKGNLSWEKYGQTMRTVFEKAAARYSR